MYERTLSPARGYRFYASKAMVEQGVNDVEAHVKAVANGERIEPYDAVYITLNAQCEALWRCRVAGTA